MVFSSFIFLCLFLPATVLLYYLCPRRLRNGLLLVLSLFFYAWGEPRYLCIMLFSTVFDYCNGLLINRFQKKSRPGAARAVLLVSLAVNLGLLGFFKYTDFFLGTVNSLTGAGIGLLHLALPIGISFYTFQTLSYTIDVYRKQVTAQRNFIDFAMYVSLFPQLIAGPIVRYADVDGQLRGRRESAEEAARGLCRFLIGLGKKVILANQAGALFETVSGAGTANLSALGAWLGAGAYLFQIYFDFSGYSDMAIGLGQLFGFRFPENFRYPYEADSITDFWRRWHMTLSGWFREYVYIPLGGNRHGLPRQILNLLIVWALTGIWHGAGWTFLLWGLYYFLLLVLEKTVLLRVLKKLPRAVRHVYSLLLILLGWVLFFSPDLASAGAWLAAMFGFGAGGASSQSLYELMTHLGLLAMLAVGCTHWPARLGVWLRERTRLGNGGTFILQSVWCLLVLAVSLILLAGDAYNPFLYFRF